MGNFIVAQHGYKTGKKSYGGILGVKISLTDQNPSTRVTYTDGLEEFESPSVWSGNVVPSTDQVLSRIRELCNFRSCHIKSGETSVYKYLNPDDWRYYEDGSSAIANMASSGFNTFVEIPHFYMSITSDSSYLYVRISNTKVDDTYNDWMFSYNGSVRSKLYIGSFLGYIENGKLYSRCGVSPTVSTPMNTYRTNARAQGQGYDMWYFGALVVLQVLYLMMFRSTNSQEAVCPGFTGGSSVQTTGYSINASVGDFYRSDSTSTTSRFRIFGVEDLWGNLYEYCSNIYTVGNTLYATDYNTDDSSGRQIATKAFSSNYSGYIDKVMGETYFPFVIAEGGNSGSSTTFYCDDGNVYAGSVASSGGHWSSGPGAGVFRLYVDNGSGGYSSFGSRLVVLCPDEYAA